MMRQKVDACQQREDRAGRSNGTILLDQGCSHSTEIDKAAEVFRGHGCGVDAEACGGAELAGPSSCSRVRHRVRRVEKYTRPCTRPAGRAVLARFGVGHDGIDKDKATPRGYLHQYPGV
jgi:hypothetical protein